MGIATRGDREVMCAGESLRLAVGGRPAGFPVNRFQAVDVLRSLRICEERSRCILIGSKGGKAPPGLPCRFISRMVSSALMPGGISREMKRPMISPCRLRTSSPAMISRWGRASRNSRVPAKASWSVMATPASPRSAQARASSSGVIFAVERVVRMYVQVQLDSHLHLRITVWLRSLRCFWPSPSAWPGPAGRRLRHLSFHCSRERCRHLRPPPARSRIPAPAG